MLRLESELKIKALKLSSRQKLAANCPRCYGPAVEGKRRGEPDFIVCLDGNFQHRRHTQASAEWREEPVLPSLFMPQDLVNQWEDKRKTNQNATNKTNKTVVSSYFNKTLHLNLSTDQSFRKIHTKLHVSCHDHDHDLITFFYCTVGPMFGKSHSCRR